MNINDVLSSGYLPQKMESNKQNPKKNAPTSRPKKEPQPLVSDSPIPYPKVFGNNGWEDHLLEVANGYSDHVTWAHGNGKSWLCDFGKISVIPKKVIFPWPIAKSSDIIRLDRHQKLHGRPKNWDLGKDASSSVVECTKRASSETPEHDAQIVSENEISLKSSGLPSGNFLQFAIENGT